MGIHATDDTNSDLRTQLRTQGGLRQLVGYAELIKAASVSRSTIERAWRGPWDVGEPQLPKPGKIGSRAVWSAADADAWLLARLNWQRGMVATLARVNADDLEPEQMEEQALQLIHKSVELRTGRPVELDALDVRLTRSVSEDELKEAVKQEFSLYAERFSEFDKRRAYVMAAWLFASIRPDIEKSAPSREKMIFATREILEGFGQAALNDDDWDDLIARFDDMA